MTEKTGRSEFLGGKIVKVLSTNNYFKVNIVQYENSQPKYVAYKVIKPPYDKRINKRKMNEFIKESKKWFSVKGHPLIMTPLYIDFVDDLPTIAMPYCEMSLKDYIEKNNKFDVVESLIIVAQIIKGLIYLRENGIESHQDLKPANIMLKDLSKMFIDFPPQNVHPSLKHRVIIADFGLANAYKELGKARGSLFYQAPEQFSSSTYSLFYPDIFSVGVILTELLTGKHPLGEKTRELSKIEGDSKKEIVMNWALSDAKKILLPKGPCYDKLQTLINRLLSVQPTERPSYEEVLTSILDILSQIDSSSAEYLKTVLHYYDTMGSHLTKPRKLQSLFSIAALPEQTKIVIETLTIELESIKEHLESGADVLYLCDLEYALGTLLLKESKKQEVSKYALSIMKKINQWRHKIKVEDRYPELKFHNSVLINTPNISNFEIYISVIGKVKKLLENSWGVEETAKYFSELDNITQSAYFYCAA
ncbi:protein kinase, partial [Priestia aryabhattai]|uniref:protein kinase domain-containing protein n=1 Tax=Priestia aryabhattai TaxID=412384 RepID=UPI002E1FA99A